MTTTVSNTTTPSAPQTESAFYISELMKKLEHKDKFIKEFVKAIEVALKNINAETMQLLHMCDKTKVCLPSSIDLAVLINRNAFCDLYISSKKHHQVGDPLIIGWVNVEYCNDDNPVGLSLQENRGYFIASKPLHSCKIKENLRKEPEEQF